MLSFTSAFNKLLKKSNNTNNKSRRKSRKINNSNIDENIFSNQSSYQSDIFSMPPAAREAKESQYGFVYGVSGPGMFFYFFY